MLFVEKKKKKKNNKELKPMKSFPCFLDLYIQSTLVISTSLISNNHLSRSEIWSLFSFSIWTSNNRQQNNVE